VPGTCASPPARGTHDLNHLPPSIRSPNDGWGTSKVGVAVYPGPASSSAPDEGHGRRPSTPEGAHSSSITDPSLGGRGAPPLDELHDRFSHVGGWTTPPPDRRSLLFATGRSPPPVTERRNASSRPLNHAPEAGRERGRRTNAAASRVNHGRSLG